MTSRDYFKRLLPTRERVERFLDKQVYLRDRERNNSGRTYHPTLGFVLKDARLKDGMHGSYTLTTIDGIGARTRVNLPDVPPRINSYGNSFTMCCQVNNGETWQEYLGAHLGEPIGNYGVGGYSVYQAYLRMLLVEEQCPRNCVILNIWEDDHYRSLDAWKSIRAGRISQMGNGFSMPYLSVDPITDAVTEHPNPCPTPESVYNMADLDWLIETFSEREHLPLRAALARLSQDEVTERTDTETEVGLIESENATNMQQLRDEHTRAALCSSKYVITKLEKYIEASGKRLLLVLSYGASYFKDRLTNGTRWDQSFVDFVSNRGYPVFDLSSAHLLDFQSFNCSPDQYLERFFTGHYKPAGNHFCAMAMIDQLASCLDVKPPSYAG